MTKKSKKKLSGALKFIQSENCLNNLFAHFTFCDQNTRIQRVKKHANNWFPSLEYLV